MFFGPKPDYERRTSKKEAKNSETFLQLKDGTAHKEKRLDITSGRVF